MTAILSLVVKSFRQIYKLEIETRRKDEILFTGINTIAIKKSASKVFKKCD